MSIVQTTVLHNDSIHDECSIINDNFNVFLDFVSCMNKYIEVLYVVCTIDLILNSPAVLPFPNLTETPKLRFLPFPFQPFQKRV